MTWVDRLGQRWRIAKAKPYIDHGSRVLDVGCADGALFRDLAERIGDGVGVDPDAPELDNGRFLLVRGQYPAATVGTKPFDVVVALAMLEHVPRDVQPELAAACYRQLRPGGRAIVTVPSPAVDPILDVLRWLRLGEGMAVHQHYGFRPAEVVPLFEAAGFVIETSRRFQLGLNNMFVFKKPLADVESGHPTP